jgi:hypothetical protein
MLGDSKKADDSEWVAPSSLIHGWPIALGATARPTKPANSITVTRGRGTVVEPLFCNRAARVKDFKLEPAPRRSSGRGHSSVRGRRGGPPQAGVRHGPSASIFEAAWLPIERDPSVTTEAAELWSRAGSSTAVLNASAITAPTLGTVIRQRHTWSCLATATPALCRNASWLMKAARVGDHASSPLRVTTSLSTPAFGRCPLRPTAVRNTSKFRSEPYFGLLKPGSQRQSLATSGHR